jgi:formylglycine-generating enzyme required for sulfatase activity
MKGIQGWCGRLVIALMCSGVAGMSLAGGLVIQSFDSTGQLAFNTLPTATVYRVEWASSPNGPWTNSWAALAAIPHPSTGGIVTCSVPMCYRVVATVTNYQSMADDYLVIDLSAGSSATTYPVSQLAGVPEGGWSDEYKTTKIVLKRIRAGSFTMGSPDAELGHRTDEAIFPVSLSQDFYIGLFEVTQRQWERVMGSWPSYFNNVSYRESRPVEKVSYETIRGADWQGVDWPASGNVGPNSFMGRLRTRTGRMFDLPTEAQWEYAARAATTTALNSGSNLTSTDNCPNMAEVGRYWHNGGSSSGADSTTANGTAKAGSYRVNAWGLYDMHGNVYEWCLDWYGSYPTSGSDPKGALTGTGRVFRSGSWVERAGYCRAASRLYIAANSTYNFLGLRVVVLP